MGRGRVLEESISWHTTPGCAEWSSALGARSEVKNNNELHTQCDDDGSRGCWNITGPTRVCYFAKADRTHPFGDNSAKKLSKPLGPSTYSIMRKRCSINKNRMKKYNLILSTLLLCYILFFNVYHDDDTVSSLFSSSSSRCYPALNCPTTRIPPP